MSECKHLSKEYCLKNPNCKYINGEKRQFCRKAKNTMKNKRSRKKQASKSSKTKTTTINKKIKRSNAPSSSSSSSSRRTSVSSKKSLSKNILKISNTYQDLGIKAGDFFIDPCMMLRKLKKYSNNDIYTFTETNIKHLENIIPLFEKSGSNSYKFGNETLILKKKINSGAYGEIYDATINKKKVILKIPKLRHFNMKDFFLETFVQNELFCDLRGSFGQGARIPKLEFFGKMKIESKVVGKSRRFKC